MTPHPRVKLAAPAFRGDRMFVYVRASRRSLRAIRYVGAGRASSLARLLIAFDPGG